VALSRLAERLPRPDTNFRARAFCSVHPWAAALRSPAYEEHAARLAIGRDWAAWEAVSAELRLTPAPDADLADDPLLVLEAGAFSAMWRSIERHWASNLAEGVLVALTTPEALYKHCVRGDALFLEITYRMWQHQRLHTGVSPRHEIGRPERGGSVPPPRHADATDAGRAPTFRNATALVEAVLPPAARPLGFAHRPPLLPSSIDARWFHAAPSGLSRLWLYASADDGLGTAAAKAIERLYEHASAAPATPPLVALRFDFEMPWANGTAHACRVLDIAVRRLRAPAGAMLLSSSVPDALWRECADALRGVHAPAGVMPPRPKYWRHRAEWEPAY